MELDAARSCFSLRTRIIIWSANFAAKPKRARAIKLLLVLLLVSSEVIRVIAIDLS